MTHSLLLHKGAEKRWWRNCPYVLSLFFALLLSSVVQAQTITNTVNLCTNYTAPYNASHTYRVCLTTVTYDFTNNRSTWTYTYETLSGNNISHIVFGGVICANQASEFVSVGGSCGSTEFKNPDNFTDVVGMKFDCSNDNANPRTVSFTLNGIYSIGLIEVGLKPGSNGFKGMVAGASCTPLRDFGDLPDNNVNTTSSGNYQTLFSSNNAISGPYHTIANPNTLRMGANVDAENDGLQSALATGDDTNSTPDDEDGIATFPTFIPGQNATVNVSLTNTTGGNANLYGFIDWNNDGDFGDTGEAPAAVTILNNATTANITFSVPSNAVQGVNVGARFRLTTNNLGTGGAAAIGSATNGEVEDYWVPIEKIELTLTALCKAGNTLYWRVNGDDKVNNVAFTWDGPGANDGNGVVNANSTFFFTTQDAGGANTTIISWNGGTNTKAHNNSNCVYHITFEKTWQGATPPALKNIVVLTAESSIATASCGYNSSGVWYCDYRQKSNNAVLTDLEVPFGQSYDVTENVLFGWTATSGVGQDFNYVVDYDETALPGTLGYELSNVNRHAVPIPGGEAKYGKHTVVNTSTPISGECEDAFMWMQNYSLIALGNLNQMNEGEGNVFVGGDLNIGNTFQVGINLTTTNYGTNGARKSLEVAGGVIGGSNITMLNYSAAFASSVNYTSGNQGTVQTIGGGTRTINLNNNLGLSNVGIVQDGTLPAKANQMEADLQAASTEICAAANTSNYTFNTATQNASLTINNNSIAVINLSAAQAATFFATTTSFQISTPNNAAHTAPIVINVKGSSFNIPNTFNMGNIPSELLDNVIWNFCEATSVSIPSVVKGSLLAPFADVTLGNNIDGVLVGQNVSIGSESHMPFLSTDFSSLCTPPCDLNLTGLSITNNGATYTFLFDVAWTNAPAGNFQVFINGSTTAQTITRTNSASTGSQQIAVIVPAATAVSKVEVRFANETSCSYTAVFPSNPVDPLGYIYCAGTGELVLGGTISVTPPPGGGAVVFANGANGKYDFFTNGTTGVYTISYTPPAGYTATGTPGDRVGDTDDILNPTSAEDNPGNVSPLILGSSDANNDNFLDNPALSANPFFTSIYITNGTPAIMNNNFPMNCPQYDLGDLPDLTAGTATGDYQTLAANNGPQHLIVPTIRVGTHIDGEANGQQSANATGDDTNGTPDDEDGISSFPTFTAGESANVSVNVFNNTGSAATLYGWIDFNNNGAFDNMTERVSVNVPTGTNGNVTLTFNVPANAAINTNIGARFRLSTDGAAANATGSANNGEVEDYFVQVVGFDRGDLPDTGNGTGTGNYQTQSSDDGPRHQIASNIRIGTNIDAEATAQQSANATGDDTNGTDDEDGITSFPTFVPGQNATVTVNLTNTTGSNANLYGFIDWNSDGDFADTGEAPAVVTVANNATSATITFTVPNDAVQTTNIGARFRLTTTNLGSGAAASIGAASNGEVEDYLVQVAAVDRGDLPDTGTGTGTGNYQTLSSDSGPQHQIVATIRMGTNIDGEATAQQSANANGDDTNGTPDDEDGIPTFPTFTAGESANVSVNVFNNTGSAATLYGWIDYNNDGAFDNMTERVSVNVPTGTNGNVTLNFTVPANATLNTELGARFRLSTDAAAANATGSATNGEVEDYFVRIVTFDRGDLPDTGMGTGAGNYQTLNNDNGPRHQISNNLRLGATIDTETNGQPSANATGDDTNGTDDEDGIAAFPSFAQGANATVTVSLVNTTGGNANLYGFIDWNNDGDFADAGEAPTAVTVANNATSANITFSVPANAVIGRNVGARFRLTTDNLGSGAAASVGLANNGEVEDYIVQADCPPVPDPDVNCTPPNTFTQTITSTTWAPPNGGSLSNASYKITGGGTVTINSGDLKLGTNAVVYLENVELIIKGGGLVLEGTGARFIMVNSTLRTFADLLLNSANSYLCTENSKLEIGDELANSGFTTGNFSGSTGGSGANFNNTKGYVYLRSTCMNVTQNFENKNNTENGFTNSFTTVDVCLELGDRGANNATGTIIGTKDGDDSGNGFVNSGIFKAYDTQIVTANGGFDNQSSGVMTVCDVSVKANVSGSLNNQGTLQGKELCIAVQDQITNTGTWTALVEDWYSMTYNAGASQIATVVQNQRPTEAILSSLLDLCFEDCCGTNASRTDFGDLPNTYPTATAIVGPDTNNDGKPESNPANSASPAVWAGNIVDSEVLPNFSNDALGDDFNDTSTDNDDEDGLIFPVGNLVKGGTYNFTISTNSNSPSSITRYWALWFDWDNNGTFETYLTNSVSGIGNVAVVQSITVPGNAVDNYKVRLVVSSNPIANTPGGTFTNAEVEDYLNTTPLPIELLDFNATLTQNNQVLLKWRTLTEKNNAYFSIQRSRDGITWKEIGQEKGAGNSQTVLTYDFIDLQPLPGNNYYRFQQFDFDGTAAFSPIRVVTIDDRKGTAWIYPNPTAEQLFVQFSNATIDEERQLEVFSITGQSMKTVIRSAENGTLFTLDTADLAPGTYFLRITDRNGDNVQVLRFIRK